MDILQDYPQVEFMLALHEGVAVSMADAYARLTRRPAFVEVHIAPGLGNALGMMHNARIGKTPHGRLRRAVAEQRPVAGAASVGPAGRHGAADRQVVGAGRARARRAARAAAGLQDRRRAAPGPGLPGAADGRARRRRRTSRSRRRPIPTGARDPDAAGLAEVADLLVRARRPMLMVGDSVALAEAQSEVVRVAELLGAPMFECYASEFNVAGRPPAESGQRRFRLAQIDSRRRWPIATCCSSSARPVFQLIFPEPEQPVLGPETHADPARLLHPRARQERAARHRAARRSEVGPGRAGRAARGAPDGSGPSTRPSNAARRPRPGSREHQRALLGQRAPELGRARRSAGRG